ncbi:TPA: hypothetical protein ACF02O_004455, partial [Yersinia enterocolitica]
KKNTKQEHENMGFISQLSKTKISSRRGSASQITVTQSFKPSTSAEELSIRVSIECLKNISLKIGDNADILYDAESDTWMIKKEDDGYKISGKDDAPTGLIRYTLKEGHKKFTNKRESLPVRKDSNDESIVYMGDKMTFKLKEGE